jgi:hypothetical protein
MDMVSFLVVFLNFSFPGGRGKSIRSGNGQTIRLRLNGRSEFKKGFGFYRIVKADIVLK